MKFNTFITSFLVFITIMLALSILTARTQYKKLERDLDITKEKLHSTKSFIDNIYTIYYKSLPIEKLTELDFISAETLLAGSEEMKKHKAVFTGISRDNALELSFVMRHIEYVGKFFADYRVIVFENDSSDGTKEILNIWQNLNPKVKIASQDFSNEKRPSIKFMADARNKYLEIMATKDYDDFDIVIPLDMDMGYGFDVRGIENSFSKINQWDAVCSNGVKKTGHMYDAFAFRNETFNHSVKFYLDYDERTGEHRWNRENIRSMQKIYPPSSDLMPVYSCFGGLAIYKKELFDGCFYDSIEGDCEHVYLHECMRSKHNARIFMNPTQIIRYINY